MRSGRLRKTGSIQVGDDFPEPQITQPDEVKIRVRYAAVGADDYKSFRGELGRIYNDEALFQGMSGEVVEIGAVAKNLGLQVGDRVSRNMLRGCGICPMCRKGRENLCTDGVYYGASSEYLLCHANSIVRLPEEVSMEEGALYWLTATCIRCIERLHIEAGSSVLILGGGTAGQILLQLVMKCLPSVVMLSDPIASKRLLAKRMGASIVIDPSSEDFTGRALEVTGGIGFDIAIDASGVKGALENALESLARGGKLMLFSNYGLGEYFHIDLMDLYWKEYTICTSFGADNASYTSLSGSILNRLTLFPLIDQILPLEEMQKALEMYGTRQYMQLLLKI